MGEIRETKRVVMNRVYHRDLISELGLSSTAVTLRAKSKGISSKRCDKNSHYTYYTKIEAEAIRNPLVKINEIDEEAYAKVVQAFKTLKDNRTSVIAKVMSFPVGTVERHINRYLKSVSNKTDFKFMIVESKMNFEDFT